MTSKSGNGWEEAGGRAAEKETGIRRMSKYLGWVQKLHRRAKVWAFWDISAHENRKLMVSL